MITLAITAHFLSETAVSHVCIISKFACSVSFPWVDELFWMFLSTCSLRLSLLWVTHWSSRWSLWFIPLSLKFPWILESFFLPYLSVHVFRPIQPSSPELISQNVIGHKLANLGHNFCCIVGYIIDGLIYSISKLACRSELAISEWGAILGK